MKVNHSHEFFVLVDNGHRDYSVLFHSIYHSAPKLVIPCNTRGGRHDSSNGDWHHVVLTLHETRKVTGRDHSGDAARLITNHSYSATLSKLDDRLFHRRVRREHWHKVACNHHIAHLRQQLPTECS